MKPATHEDLARYKLKQIEPLQRYGCLYLPLQADPPILAHPVRQAMQLWMAEMNADEALAEWLLEPRRSAMLSGPPGCGKTTFAHHFAARLGLPLCVVEMHNLTSKWVGQTGEQIGALFRAIRANGRNLVLFLDEFDAVGSKRLDQATSAATEKNAIVIAFLQEIDRAETMIMAATNRREAIDPALWRRFGLHVEIGLPDFDQRWAIATRYLYPLGLPQDTMDELAHLLEGATPALIRQIMEGIKRDLFFAPRLTPPPPADAPSVFARVLATVEPAEGLPRPQIYDAPKFLAAMSWPPAIPERQAA